MIQKRGGIWFGTFVLFVILLVSSAMIYASNDTVGLVNESVADTIMELPIEAPAENVTEIVPEDPEIVPDYADIPSVVVPSATGPLLALEDRDVPFSLHDSDGDTINADVLALRVPSSGDAGIMSELYAVQVTPSSGPVAQILFDDVVVGDTLELGIDDVPETIPGNDWEEVYAIDPSSLSFTSATVSVTATGNQVYKCKEWDFDAQECTGTWEYFMNVVPGQEYYFALTSDDPAFGEIIATDAVHLDESYVELSNIYDDVRAADGVWSEPIYGNEFVRVTFAQNLTDGRMIDVFVRSNNTIAYFNVYEAGTGRLVGRSSIIGREELFYIPVSNLSQPTNVFDFKVVKVYPDPSDDSTDLYPDLLSFLQFDYIHDDLLNATHADGLIVYGELDIATPRYRLYNESNAFTAEANANSVGTDGSADITWVVTRGNHEYNQTIMGTEDKTNDVNIQIYNQSGAWSNLLEVSVDVPNSAHRSFDIAVEDVSGDALIVFEGNSVSDSVFTYRIWNGTAYSAPVNETIALPGAISWVQLRPKRESDDIMLFVRNTTQGLYAVPWNGTGFDHTKNLTLSGVVTAGSGRFYFSWEEISGGGLLSYGTATAVAFREYSGSSWGAESTIELVQALTGVRSCSDPRSNYIGVIWQDAGNDVNVRMWNGTAFLASPPTEDSQTEVSGLNNNNFDCVWVNSTTALFGFVEFNGLEIDYFSFTKNGDAFSTTALTTTSISPTFASDDIGGLRFVGHPTTEEVMAVAMDILEDVTVIRWNGTAFATIAASPLEGSTEVLNGDQEGAMFDWFRYDPVPSVVNLTPVNGSNFTSGSTVSILVNVSDNVAVSAVLANVTLPNGSIEQRTLLDRENDTSYNGTFSSTSAQGMYIIRIIANDTSSHRNVNSSVTTAFNVLGDVVNPSVTDAIPTAGSAFNVSTGIEIGANVTDDVAVGSVRANVTFPNSTVQQLTLSLVSGTNKYNTSFTIPLVIGRYNVTFIANDSSNNVNTSLTTFFIGNDSIAPNVTDAIPVQNTSFNVSDVIEIGANVTDNFNVSTVLANVTWPNSTLQVVTLSRVGTTNKYNSSFTIPAVIGRYNVTFMANDSNDNRNGSLTTFFIGNDSIPPNVTDVIPSAGSSFGVNATLEIGANVSDNYNVSAVLANLTWPNSTLQLLVLTRVGTTNKYNVSFTTSSVITGRYNVTFVANDSNNNVNNTVTTYFTTNDTVAPSVVNMTPTAGSSFNVSDSIEIGADVTDDVSVSSVRANVTWPNSTLQLLTLSRVGSTNRYNTSFTIPRVIGRYNITFLANDTTNNLNSSETTFFIGNDSLSPVVTVLSPAANSSFNISDTVEVAANVTDNYNVSQVFANVTFPNSTLQVLTLSRVGLTDKYNVSFTVPGSIGRYNITFIANDSNGNRNTTETTFFIGNDTIAPNVTDVIPTAGSYFNVTNIVEVGANVTDNYNVSQVFANVTIPNSSIQVLTLSRVGTTNKYNGSFTVPDVQGRYNITFIANDSNGILNRSVVTHFFVNDTSAPLVFNLAPTAGREFNFSDAIEIGANVTDNVAVSSVRANITFPNGTVQLQTLTRVGSTDRYNVSFTVPVVVGRYNITFIANDSTNLVNNTETTFFIGNDTVRPSVINLSPAEGTTFNVSEVVEIAVNATDNGLISGVLANLTLSNGSLQVLSLSRVGSTDKYNTSFTIPLVLGRYNITYTVNDSLNNRNLSVSTFFIANDSFAPNVTDVIPTAGTFFNQSQVIEIGANVTDNFNVSVVRANLTFPNTTVQLLTLSRVTGTNKYNTSFTVPEIQGRFNVTFIANDTVGNVNNSVTTFFRVNDTTSPLVFDLIPTGGSTFNISTAVEIGANVTDNDVVSAVLANVTFPNNTRQQIVLSRVGVTNKFNGTFTAPALLGSYNVTFIANDTSNNVNSTERTNFTVTDGTAPTIAIIGCVPVNANLSQTIVCNATVTDSIGVGTVTANVTMPNGTVQIQTVTNISSNYSFTFTNTVIVGRYNVTWRANDTSNNVNVTTDYFNVSDVTRPLVNLNEPANNTNTSSTSLVFNFTALDDAITAMTCSLRIDSTINQTNTNVANNTLTSFTVTNFVEGRHFWNVTCNDSSANTNTSATRVFAVDLTPVNFISLTTDPSSEAGLDPSVNVTVLANVTDNVTTVNTVIFQRRLSNETTFVNTTMVFNTSRQLFITSFNATVNGTYVLRLFANDTVGNSAFSNTVNISVQPDKIWERTPSTFTAVGADPGQNVTLGTLIINNTGDVALNFTLSSSSGNTSFNVTSPVSVSAGAVKRIIVNDTAPSNGTKTVVITMTTDSDASPSSATTNGTIVVAPGQPILVATFTTPSTDTFDAERGDTGVGFTAKLENIGTGNASNGTFFIEIPSEWTLTFGTLNSTFSELVVNDSLEKTIEVTIPSNATLTQQTVRANASGVNGSGVDLRTLGLIFADTVLVNVSETTPLGGTPEEEEGAPAEGGGAAGGGAGGGSSSGGAVTRVGTGQTIYSTDVVEVVRGGSGTFNITLTNYYDNAYMDVEDFEIVGFLSQYIRIQPIIDPSLRVFVETQSVSFIRTGIPVAFNLNEVGNHTVTLVEVADSTVVLTFASDPFNVTVAEGEVVYLDLTGDGEDDSAVRVAEITDGTADIRIYKLGSPEPGRLYYGESRDFSVDIFAPAYLQGEVSNLTIKITSSLVAINPELAGFTTRELIEYRTIVFAVLEVDPSIALARLEQARQDVQEMIDAGFPVHTVSELLLQAEDAFTASEYEQTINLANQIHAIRRTAFEADDIMRLVAEGISKANERLLDVPEAEEALALARQAFEREDFDTALQRAKDAQLLLLLETAGRVNLLWFFSTYWWAVLLGLVALAILLFFSYKWLAIAIIGQRLHNLQREERAIHSLIEDTQLAYLKEGTMTQGEYNRTIEQYEGRLNKIHQLQARLRARRVGLSPAREELMSLDHEEKEIKEAMKQLQTDYLRKGTVSRSKFTSVYDGYKQRLADIEDERETVRRRLAEKNQKSPVRRRLFSLFQKSPPPVEPNKVYRGGKK